MPITIKIKVDKNNAVSGRTGGKMTAQEISLALTHIKIREKELLELFEKISLDFKDSKEK